MFLCFLCQEGLEQRTVGGIQLDWMWRGKHKACPHGVKKARQNVEWLSALQRKEEGLETPGVVINTQQAWVQGKELTQVPPLCLICPVLAWLRNKQIWWFLDFKAVHLISFPHFLLTLFQKKLERRKYIYFCFKKRLSKYVKHIGWNRSRMGISEKARGEKYSTRTLQWTLILKVKYQAFLVKEKIPSIHQEL